MRALHLISTLDPAAGGPAESVGVLLGHKDAYYQGEVVTLDDPSAPYLKDRGFPIHALGPVKTTYGYSRNLGPWLTQNADRFDLFVVNGLWQYIGFAICLQKRARPYVVFSHGMLDPYFKRQFPFKHLKKWLYWASVEYWVLRGAFRVLFTTDTERRDAERTFWPHKWKGLVVPYGSDVPPAYSEELLANFFKKCPAITEKRFLLFLGRIHRKKGCDLLIKAFSQASLQDPNLHLVMAGPDSEGWIDKLKSVANELGIAERIEWPGLLLGNEKWGAFYSAEAFILPSHQENFGIAVAESLSCGTPVLVSDKVNIASNIAEDECGFVESDTEQGTVNLLSRWIGLPADLRKQMQANALKAFDNRYNLRRTGEALADLVGKAKRAQIIRNSR